MHEQIHPYRPIEPNYTNQESDDETMINLFAKLEEVSHDEDEFCIVIK